MADDAPPSPSPSPSPSMNNAHTRVGLSLHRSTALRILYPVYNTAIGRFLTRMATGAKPHTSLPNDTDVILADVALGLTIHAVPVLSDNWSYLMVVETKTDGRLAVAVDVADYRSTAQMCTKLDAKLALVLCTHHHWDHCAGHADVRRELPDVPIFAPAKDNVPETTHAIKQPGVFAIVGGKVAIGMLPVYGLHTKGHASFYVAPATSEEIDFDVAQAPNKNLVMMQPSLRDDEEDARLPSARAVFTGDALFRLGVGKFFENTAEEATRALAWAFGEQGQATSAGGGVGQPPPTRRKALPDSCLTLTGHEYGPANAAFAAHVFSDEAWRADEAVRGKQAREAKTAFGWSTLGEERRANPFLAAATSPEIAPLITAALKTFQQAKLPDPPSGDPRVALVATLRVLRDAKVGL
ncbi:paroxysmal nonkinesiogenic dyskinesia protein [Pseudoscourfieldia marina]